MNDNETYIVITPDELAIIIDTLGWDPVEEIHSINGIPIVVTDGEILE